MKSLLFFFSFFFLFSCMNKEGDCTQGHNGSIKPRIIDSINSNLDIKKLWKYYDLEKANANHENVRKLILDGKGYYGIPKEVFKFKNLEQLFLPDNRISIISSDIQTLENLKMLVVSTNKIEVIPKAICELQVISVLDFNFNPISNIPDCIFEMSKLHYLGLNLYKANDSELSKFINLSKKYGTEVLLFNGRIENGLLVDQ